MLFRSSLCAREVGWDRRSAESLSVLDTQTLALQAAQARAQIEAQRQSLRKLESGTRPQEVAQAQSRVAAARADAARARQDLARLRQLGYKAL